MIILIACIDNNRGIGKNNSLPWYIPEDLKFFKKATNNHYIVMGKNTWISIDKAQLPNRKTLILTNDNNCPLKTTKNDVIELSKSNNVFIVGGQMIYELFIDFANYIYLTILNNNFQCDKFFPFIPEDFIIFNYQTNLSCNDIKYNRVFYKKNEKHTSHQEYNYLNLVEKVLKYGNSRPDRTNTGTISYFGNTIEFNITDSVPLLTTKKVVWEQCIIELLWFLSGSTDSKVLEKQGVNIWKGNSSRDFLNNRGLDYPEGVIGPGYGFQWRNFGAKYSVDYATVNNCTEGIDQINNMLNLLLNDPFSRRICMTAWNPSALDEMALVPCHKDFQFYITEKNGKKYLSGHMYQRSCDLFLGEPFNIFSYTVLIYIYAIKIDAIPDRLIISLGDIHIYNNHINQIKQQMTRKPTPFPKLILNKDIRHKDWNNIQLSDFKLIGYIPHPFIKGDMAV